VDDRRRELVHVNIEFIGRAAQPGKAWEDEQIRQGARWAAYWALKYDIPVQKANVRNVNGLCVCTRKGVLRHSDVTAAGFGTHQDPGPAVPDGRFLPVHAVLQAERVGRMIRIESSSVHVDVRAGTVIPVTTR
jgi:hypothetical protein